MNRPGSNTGRRFPQGRRWSVTACDGPGAANRKDRELMPCLLTYGAHRGWVLAPEGAANLEGLAGGLCRG